MKYKVRYQDNTGNGNVITEYATEELAEKAIKEELEACELALDEISIEDINAYLIQEDGTMQFHCGHR